MNLRRYIRTFRNWPSVFFNVYRKNFNFYVKYRDGRKIKVLSQAHLYFLSFDPKNLFYDQDDDLLSFNFNGNTVKFKGALNNGDVASIFGDICYKADVNGKTVIDIGANIGDTAIYFCLNNAERVVAIEPFPYSYKYAKFNVIANNMIDKIEILNAGYGKDSEVNIKDKKSTASDIIEISDNGKKINTYSLGTLINMCALNNKDDLILKMDCEGCEYNLLDEPIDVLRKFKIIEMEFHYGYKNLEFKLEEAGFSVEHSKPSKSFLSESSLRKMALINKDLTIGYIYAERLP